MMFLLLPVVPGLVDTYLGGPAVLALVLLILAFGTKFLDEEELNRFNWDLVLVLGGTNVISYAVAENGLGADLARIFLTEQDILTTYIWTNTIQILVILVTSATFMGQTNAAIMCFPIVASLAVRLYS